MITIRSAATCRLQFLKERAGADIFDSALQSLVWLVERRTSAPFKPGVFYYIRITFAR